MAISAPSKPHAPALLGLELDRRSGVPAFRQIAEGLRQRIHGGALAAGARLPPSRALALQLSCARNGVVDAYDELIADGLLEGRGRHGTFVAARAATSGQARAGEGGAPLVLRRQGPRASGPAGAPAAALDWRPGQAQAQALPLDAWRAACREAGRHLPPQGYGDPRGDAGLRGAIVAWLAQQRSVRVTAGQVVLTQGTGQALDLIARALLRPGDCCATEDPGYAGAAQAFARAGAALRHVRVDADGIDVEQVFCAGPAPAMLHITPSHQYPMGGRLSGPRRRALVEAARRHGTLILENEYDCEFNYAGTAYPPVYSSAPESTLLLSTFAKAVSPALRLGFIVAPPDAAAALADHVERARLHASWPAQKVTEALLRSGELERHLRRVRRHYAALRELIRARLERFREQVAVLGDDGGLHVVVRASSPARDRALQAALTARGVRYDTVRQFATGQPDAGGFLLAYGHMDGATLAAALDALQVSLEEQCKK